MCRGWRWPADHPGCEASGSVCEVKDVWAVCLDLRMLTFDLQVFTATAFLRKGHDSQRMHPDPPSLAATHYSTFNSAGRRARGAQVRGHRRGVGGGRSHGQGRVAAGATRQGQVTRARQPERGTEVQQPLLAVDATQPSCPSSRAVCTNASRVRLLFSVAHACIMASLLLLTLLTIPVHYACVPCHARMQTHKQRR